MNSGTRNVLLAAAILMAIACGGKKEEHDHHTQADALEWKEMDEFHMIMAETFHPYKDSANLEPVKSRAEELVAAADKWSDAELPAKVDNDEMKGRLEALKTESATLAGIVNTGDDKAIGEHLTTLHDLFHEIQEEWYGSGGEEEDHEHH